MNPRLFLLLLLMLLTAGCQQLETSYATYRGKSINGIKVFAELLREKGHRVDVWPALNDKLYSDYELIVIFQQEFSGPKDESVEEVWGLAQDSDATKILYIGRDLDITPEYWDSIAQQLRQKGDNKKADQASKVANEARIETSDGLSRTFKDGNSKWFFDIKRLPNPRVVEQIARFDEDGEDQPKLSCRWSIDRMMIPPEDGVILWETTGDAPEPILVKSEYEMVDVFAMGSAYPFLNGSLINRDHQKIIDALLEEIQVNGNIAIVTSTRLLSQEEHQSSWAFLKVFPHPWIVAHFVLFVALFCLAKFPIFGRPKQSIPHDVKRFGAHIEALADLLRRTRRRDFALKQIQTWHDQQIKHRRRGANK